MIKQGDCLEWREISDIFSGATKNKMTGDYKHEKGYWQEFNRLLAEYDERKCPLPILITQ